MHRIVAIALLGVLAMAGCSSSSTGNGNGAGGGGGGGGAGSCTRSPNQCLGPGNDTCNPCSKITDAQASAAVGGVTLTPGTQNANACGWNENDANGNLILSVQFTVGDDPKVDFGPDSVCSPPAGSGFNTLPLSGVGDEACYAQEPLYGWILPFLKGCAAYNISIAPGPGKPAIAEQQAEEKQLALDAVANL
jgi:hypothetical protein